MAARLRHESVASECAAADVFCVQELFSRDAQEFFDGLQRYGLTTTFRDHNRMHFRSRTFRGSGLGIGSKAAPIETKISHFRPSRAGWDKLARKGVLVARYALEGDLRINVMTVHLQAGADTIACDVRRGQLDELAQFVEESADDHPFIVCGDFNICGLGPLREKDEYRHLRKSLPGFDDLGADADLPTLDPRPESNRLARRFADDPSASRVDYVFFRPAVRDAARFQCDSIERTLDRPLHETPDHYASDHYGLQAAFRY